MRILKASLALIFASLSMLHAQDGVNIHFRAVSWNAGQPGGFTYMNAGKAVLVEELQSTVRSEMLHYTGPSPLVLYAPDAVIPPPKDTKPPEPIAVIPIPSNIRYPLLILVPNPDGDKPLYKGMMFDDDPSAFPFPSYSFINLCGSPVAISLGENQFGLEPGKRKLATSKEKTLNLRLAVQKAGSENWNVIYDNFYPNWPTERTLMFITDIKRNDRTYIEPRVLLENQGVWDRAKSPKKDAELP